MSFWDKMRNMTHTYSDDEYDDYDEEMDSYDEEPASDPAPRTRRPSPFSSAASIPDEEEDLGTSPAGTAGGFNGQVLNMNTGKQEVVLFHAKTFDDAAKAANELRSRKAVILNMENVDKSLTRRVVDFLSGSVYALDGSVKKVAQATYLFCPHNMDVVGDLENLQSEVASYL